MKINANLIRVGNIIKHQGKMFIILNTSIIKPGKGGAFIQVEMRDIISKIKLIIGLELLTLLKNLLRKKSLQLSFLQMTKI